jgi:hypothetical protein
MEEEKDANHLVCLLLRLLGVKSLEELRLASANILISTSSLAGPNNINYYV